jgi:3-deoxy-manno-octulosonate cytidylyltransferase (CMP-KDO synthetase)
MSRSIIPISKSGEINIKKLKKNVGVFFFKKNFLNELKKQKNIETYLDKYKGLEQLRWLELGYKIKVIKINHYGYGIDVPEQIKLLVKRVKCLQKQKKYE